MKSQFLKIFKSWNFAQFLRFLPNVLHVSSILYIFNLCIATWSLKQLFPWFPRGGYKIPPPLAWDEIDTPWEIGLNKDILKTALLYSFRHDKGRQEKTFSAIFDWLVKRVYFLKYSWNPVWRKSLDDKGILFYTLNIGF